MNELQIAEELQISLREVGSVVFKGYLDFIEHFDIQPLDCSLDDAIINIRLTKLTRIVYDKHENNLDKLMNAFGALHSSDSSLVILLKGKKEYTDIYIGTNKLNSNDAFDADATLKAALHGNFQGIEFGEDLFNSDIEALLKPMESSDKNYITSIVGVPSLKRDDDSAFSQGIEKIIEGMKNRDYTAVIQATPVLREELEVMESAYQDIASSLSIFEQQQVTLSKNESKAFSSSISEGVTNTLSVSTGKTQSHTLGVSNSVSHSETKTRSDIDIKKALSQGVSGALGGAVSAAAVVFQ